MHTYNFQVLVYFSLNFAIISRMLIVDNVVPCICCWCHRINTLGGKTAHSSEAIWIINKSIDICKDTTTSYIWGHYNKSHNIRTERDDLYCIFDMQVQNKQNRIDTSTDKNQPQPETKIKESVKWQKWMKLKNENVWGKKYFFWFER